MALWRIVVKGQQIQGVGFRERAAYAFNTLEIKGKARNIKETGEVEFLLLSDQGEEALRQVIAGVIEKTGELIPIALEAEIAHIAPVEEKYLEDTIAGVEKFEVLREDDLQEMVWALQGAGNLFMTATKTINELLKYKKNEMSMRLKAIRCELAHAQNKMGNAKNLDLLCLGNFIANPLVSIHPETLQPLVDFYHDFAEFKAIREEEERKKEMTNMANRIKKIMELVEKIGKDAKSS